MPACDSCKHSHFCTPACAAAAAPHHGRVCAALAAEADVLSFPDGHERFCHETYLFHLLSLRRRRVPNKPRVLRDVHLQAHGPR